MDTARPSLAIVPAGADGASAAAGLAETHTALVVFVGERAFKLKKPVSLGFLDFSTREARKEACEREVALNRRLAPDVYLGVVDVVDADGRPCEHLVVMRRLPERARLSSLAAAGAPLEGEMRRLARLLAAFHTRAERSEAIDEASGPEAMLARFEANAARLGELPGELHHPAASQRVLELARAYLVGRGPLLAGRVAAGRACDGHGDLLADDIFCLDDGPRILDCLEFDDTLRFGDALGDVAFLAMDLERLGRDDLAGSLLEEYGRFSGDSWPASLAHLHLAHRAQVRALVAAVRAVQGVTASAETARSLLALALAHLEAGRVRLVVVGGLPGTGKSTLAAGLADALGACLLRSDELRKQSRGLDVATPGGAALDEGLYDPSVTAATYATLLERARICLSHGESVVLDATFTDPRWRAEARALAGDASAVLGELRCTAPADVAASRLSDRAGRGDASDATAAVAATMADRDQPWPTAATVDTSGPPAETRRTALALLVGAASLRSRP